jgi:tetratricopeptide (TPR) repeat protein
VSRVKLRELKAFLFSEEELHIAYHASAIGSAVQAFDERVGNCLALTTLFVAAARHVGLDANYQIAEVQPSWDHQSGTMIRYEHIVVAGRLRAGEYVIDFLPQAGAEDGSGRRISDANALALHYNNEGAEKILGADLPGAISDFRYALSLNPDHSDTWNNLGAAMYRKGNVEVAEFNYRRALHEDSTNLSAISNLARLFSLEGREEEAAKMNGRVQRYRERNPYYYYFLANVSLSEDQYSDAIPLLERAIRLKRDDPDFHMALALSLEKTGDQEKSDRQLKLAEKYGRKPVESKRITNKLVVKADKGTRFK